ncbi:hypothetical protein QBC41DRAFT_299783 [Cercophora samala]|uniref:Uncharacterized protein n=1 Tax=Cercophora samala TaxID=330535 RepID=A0AA39ZJN4_9PEZI|nr:hypothetical protein QBC41DRAFT_299783 [Cercophora samala]
MKASIISIAASALALLGAAQGHALPDDIPDVTWNMRINPTDENSATVSITGTIERAMAKMEADYPGWKALLDQVPASKGLSLEDSGPPTINCNVAGDNYAFASYVMDGISHLRSQAGYAQNDPGKCGRVSCSYGAGILWCNNAKELLNVPWPAIADTASKIVEVCAGKDKPSYVKGHADFESWTAIIRAEDC